MAELLKREGEQINIEDFGRYLFLLVGEQNYQNAFPQSVSAEEFAQNILGFEEVEEDEPTDEEEGEGDDEKHVAFDLPDEQEVA